MKCPQCGAENLDDATYCSLCYHPFDLTGQYGDPSLMPADSLGAPPSDVFYHRIPLSHEQPDVKEGRPVGRIIRTAGIAIIMGGILAVAIILLIPYIFPDTVNYASSASLLSFEYPSDWSRVKSEQLGTVGGLDPDDFNFFNEIILADLISLNNNYLLRVASVTDITSEGFQNRRNDLIKIIAEDFYNDRDPNTATPTKSFTDTHINGNPAFTGTIEYIKGGRKTLVNLAVIHKGNTEYYFYLSSFGDAGITGGTDLFQKILNSIHFRG